MKISAVGHGEKFKPRVKHPQVLAARPFARHGCGGVGYEALVEGGIYGTRLGCGMLGCVWRRRWSGVVGLNVRGGGGGLMGGMCVALVAGGMCVVLVAG